MQRTRDGGHQPGILVHVGADSRAWGLRVSLLSAEPRPTFLLQFSSLGAGVFDSGFGIPEVLDGQARRLAAGADASPHEAAALPGRFSTQVDVQLGGLLSHLNRRAASRLAVANSAEEKAAAILSFLDDGAPTNTAQLQPGATAAADRLGVAPLTSLVQETIERVERQYIHAALKCTGGKRSPAAALAANRTTDIPFRIAMTPNPHAPEFGKADLSNCELEKIHQPNSIQPHGAMLVVRERDMVVIQASAGAEAFLDLELPVVGAELARISGELAAGIRSHLGEPLREIPLAVRCRIGRNQEFFDGLIHRPTSGGLVVELEPSSQCNDFTGDLGNLIATLVTAPTLQALCDESARVVKMITGYDRVMVYRFDKAGHGEVFAEERAAALEPYLGNHYPASDIPQMARRLYERARVRVLVDVNYACVPLEPSLSPVTGEELDMSLCRLRSMSPIHIQYLKNMGVGATLVISVLVGGTLWGLIACHHYAARRVHFKTLAVCEILAETMSTRIAALESFDQGQAQLLARRLEQRMIDATTRLGDWRGGLFDGSDTVLRAVNAAGAALLCDGQIATSGDVPAAADLRAVVGWLDGRHRTSLTISSSFGTENPDFARLTPIASGLLAAPISSAASEYLLWFRPEQVRTVIWGGDPRKPVVIGDNPADLSPRRSFAQWHEIVKGTSEDWAPADLTAAGLIAASVCDVLLQFRSLSVLVAEDQLSKVLGQVSDSDQPVLIAHRTGKILLCNNAFQRLLPPGSANLRHLSQVAAFGADDELRQRLSDLVDNRRAWRGEVTLRAAAGQAATLFARADPVFSAPDRVLGYVLMFEDISERKAANRAKQRFQEAIVTRRRMRASHLDPNAEVRLRTLVSTLLDNAQLAALEVIDGAHPSEMPARLERLENSVARSAALLAVLIGHRPPESDNG